MERDKRLRITFLLIAKSIEDDGAKKTAGSLGRRASETRKNEAGVGKIGSRLIKSSGPRVKRRIATPLCVTDQET